MPLSNIASVLAETTSGKTTRRLHFQDEVATGVTESPTDTGKTYTHVKGAEIMLIPGLLISSFHKLLHHFHGNTRGLDQYPE